MTGPCPPPASPIARLRSGTIAGGLLGLVLLTACQAATGHVAPPLPSLRPVAAPLAGPRPPPASPSPSVAVVPPRPAPVRPGGARLIVEPDPVAETVAIAAFVSAGAADEPEPGARHLLERLLLGRDGPAGTLARGLRARGSEVVSFTAPDYTLYQVVTPRASWQSGLDLVAALLAEPAGDEAAVAAERRGVLVELADLQGDGAGLRRLLIAQTPGHPYGRPLLGTPDSLGRLDGAGLRLLHRRCYRPERLTVVVVGDVSAGEVAEQLAVRLRSRPELPAAAPAPQPEPPAAAPGPRVVVAEKEGSTPELVLGFAVPAAGPSLSAETLSALDVATVLLADGAGGGRRSFLVSGQAPGMLVVAAKVPAAHALDEELRLAIRRVLALGQRPVSGSELARAQGRLLGTSALRGELPAGRAQRLGAFALLDIGESDYLGAVRSLTPGTLLARLAPLLVPENLTVSVTAGRSGVDGGRLRALVAAATRPPAVDGSALGQARVFRLRGGGRVVFVPDPRPGPVAVAALWPGGQRLEDERVAGLHALLARAWPRDLQSCTGERSSLADASLEARTGPDSFAVALQVTGSDALPAAFARLRACLERPLLGDADVERARQALLTPPGGRGRQDAEAARQAFRLFKQALYGDRSSDGPQPSEASLLGLSRRRLLDFYHQHYGRDRVTLTVVGDVPPSQFLAEVEPWLGPATPAEPAAPAPSRGGKTPLPAASQLFEHAPTQKAHLVLGFPAPGLRSDGDARGVSREAAELLLELLAPPASASSPTLGPGEGRLPRALLARRGMADTLEGLLGGSLEPGYLAFYLATAPSQLEAAEATLRDELHRLADQGADPEELAVARQRLLARRAFRSQRRLDRAFELATAAALNLPDRLLDGGDPAGRILGIDGRALQAAAHRLLSDELLVRAVVLPAPAPLPPGRLVASLGPPSPVKPAAATHGGKHPTPARGRGLKSSGPKHPAAPSKKPGRSGGRGGRR